MVRLAWLLFAGSLLLPATLWAQADSGNIAGVVRDPSGAVMPGVTVEASSPALIEKVRSVTTDTQGLYPLSICGLACTPSRLPCQASAP